ncbi:MAG: tetratricopeptide repeat protein, partial [Gammaproteobacteria bacterium]
MSGLISLERILGMQGKTAELIPAVDRLIEKDPESPIGHQMRIRAYAALNRQDDLERAAQAWIAATPNIETPYREVARVWRQRHELTRALNVLEVGRGRIRRPDALALELGDVFAESGDYGRAVREWSRAIGPGGHGFLPVQRRIMNLPGGGAAMIPQLVQALTKSPTTIQRQRAAAQIAIDVGLGTEAEAIARTVAAALNPKERQQFLVEVARRSDGAGLNSVAYWAYRELVKAGGSADQMLTVRNRLAELALALGDTASATAAYRELERAYAVGSPQRREAVAVRIQLLARDGDVDKARAEYDSFRREFPGAAETDAVASALGNALLDRGDEAGAESVLAGVTGPRSGVARGRILIRRGEVERARNELLASAPALHGKEATETIELAALLGRLSQPGGELVGKAMARAAAGEREESIDLFIEDSRSLAAAERSAILEFAASLADRAELAEQAEQVRREILTEYPKSKEAPGA